jgi:hypothetical protein
MRIDVLAGLPPDVLAVIVPFLVRAITGTDRRTQGNWGLTDYGAGVRLNSRFTEAITVYPEGVRLIVDRRKLPRRSRLKNASVETGPRGRAFYNSTPNSVCVTVPLHPLRQLTMALRALEPGLYSAISSAKSGGLSKGVMDGHSPRLVDALARHSGSVLPQPRYIRGRRSPKPTPLQLVTNWQDIRRNLVRLNSYRAPSENDAFFRNTIKRGRCFVACVVGGKRVFGPSRFIGYAANNPWRHEADDKKDGRDTNRQIESILGDKFTTSRSLETEFKKFCAGQNIGLSQSRPKFISYGPPVEEFEADELDDDISELAARGTDCEQQILARRGQGLFRKKLERMWGNRCAISGCGTRTLLRASHIKAWRESDDKERLDPFNGLLLTPSLDAAFDCGLISVADDGRLLISRRLSSRDRKILGLKSNKSVQLREQHRRYLKHHRKKTFRG